MSKLKRRSNVVVFASGSAAGGGSGFENLVRFAHGNSKARSMNVIAVVSNYEQGGVRERADRLGIPFRYFPAPWSAERYRAMADGADFVALSGWLKLVRGLPPGRTFNIHPGPLPEFGGPGHYGHHVHEAVMEAYRAGRITHTALCMHFVTPEYDKGPLIFRYNIRIRPNDTPETLAKRVNEREHEWQPFITELVVRQEIRWTGMPGDPVHYPADYRPVAGECLV